MKDLLPNSSVIYSTFAGATRSTCEEGREEGLYLLFHFQGLFQVLGTSPCVYVCVCRLELNNKFVVVKLEVEAGGAQRMAEIQGRVTGE